MVRLIYFVHFLSIVCVLVGHSVEGRRRDRNMSVNNVRFVFVVCLHNLQRGKSLRHFVSDLVAVD